MISFNAFVKQIGCTCLVLLASLGQMLGCSMFKITRDGQTWVGNNEDFGSATSAYLWTSPSSHKAFGAVYFGLDKSFAQGGVNEKGLVFDGFATEEAILTTRSKLSYLSPKKLVQQIMATASTVEEVATLLETNYFDGMTKGYLMFVDKQGGTLIAEGDTFFVRHDPVWVSTNFRPSCTPIDKITCPRQLKGKRLLSQLPSADLSSTTAVLDSIHKDNRLGGSLYSQVYDLQKGVIHLYFFNDFAHPKELIIADWVKASVLENMADLFPHHPTYKTFQKEITAAFQADKSITSKLFKAPIETLAANPWVVLFVDQYQMFFDKQLQENQLDKAELVNQLFSKHNDLRWLYCANLSRIRYRQGKRKEALDYLTQAQTLHPAQPGWVEARKKIEQLKE